LFKLLSKNQWRTRAFGSKKIQNIK